MVTILGLPELYVKLALLPIAMKQGAEAGRASGAARMAEAARVEAPVLTGAMAESVGTDGESVYVGEPYSYFVEGGTVHMQAQPFLGPAFESEQDAVVAAIAAGVGIAIVRVA